MTIRVEETEESRLLSAGYEPNQNSIDLEFFCWDDGSANLDPVAVGAAVNAVVLAAPYGDPLYNLRLQTINLRPLAKFAFTASVHYGVFEPPKITEGPDYPVKVGFSTAGGTEHITHSLGTIAHPLPGTTAADHHRAIRVTKSPNGIQGTERPVGQLSFRVTAFFDPSVWTPAEWLAINDLSNTWNLADWRGWPATYVKFENCECPDYELDQVPPYSTGQMVPATFHFKARRPEDVDKGNGIIFTKAPWSFLWDATKPYTDYSSDTPSTVNKIICTYEEQIFTGSDFTLLGLGS